MSDRENIVKGLECCSADGEICPLECPYYLEPCYGFSVLMKDALALLQEQEAEWIYSENETGVDGWHCSYCGFFEPWFYEFTDDIDFIRFYSFCPSCGRRMTSYTGKPTQEGR